MKKSIGYISYTHGLDGKVKIVPMVSIEEFKQSIQNKQIYIDGKENTKEIKLNIFAFNGKIFICSIEGITTIEQCKKIIKKEIFINTKDEEDYINPELILNFDVFVENEKNKYGNIIDYGDYGNGTLIEIKTINNKSEFYKCNYDNILNINEKEKKIVIKKRDEI